MTKRPDIATILASAGIGADPAYGSLTPPLWASDTFEWPNAEEKPEYDYSRTVNPNRDMLAAALAELEGAAGCVLTNSGQSAALLALLLVPPGGIVVAPYDCYGGTYRLISGLEEKGLIRSRFVDQSDDSAFEQAVEGAALVWIETPSNPLLRIVDIRDRAAKAKAAGALVAADNTLLTPLRQRPLALGCDLVMHSTTKALNGHGDLFGGALLTSDPQLLERTTWWSNAAGLNASAYDSWQALRGLRTLPLRVDRQEKTAGAIAEWLSKHPLVAKVHYPGLATDPGHALAARQQEGPGFMLSFRISGGAAETGAFLAELKLVTLASSLGGFSTLICVPSTMTHRGMPPEAQAEAGIDPGLLRLSVGLEAPADLIADLEAGLNILA